MISDDKVQSQFLLSQLFDLFLEFGISVYQHQAMEFQLAMRRNFNLPVQWQFFNLPVKRMEFQLPAKRIEFQFTSIGTKRRNFNLPNIQWRADKNFNLLGGILQPINW